MSDLTVTIEARQVVALYRELEAAASELPDRLKEAQGLIDQEISRRATTTYMGGGATLAIRSGKLRAAVLNGRTSVRVRGDSLRFTKSIGGGTQGITVSTTARNIPASVYARVHEFGSSPKQGIRARPYLRPALHDALPEIEQQLGDLLEARIDTAANRAALS